ELRDEPAAARVVFPVDVFVFVAFLLADADLDVLAGDFPVFAAGLWDRVTDLDCLRASAFFPPFWLLAFFAFGLAFPAMVTSWASPGSVGSIGSHSRPVRSRAPRVHVRARPARRSAARQDSGAHESAPQPAGVRSAARLAGP